jgi:hypothetical protein
VPFTDQLIDTAADLAGAQQAATGEEHHDSYPVDSDAEVDEVGDDAHESADSDEVRTSSDQHCICGSDDDAAQGIAIADIERTSFGLTFEVGVDIGDEELAGLAK